MVLKDKKDNQIIAVANLKKDEKKLCTLYVSKTYRNQGIATKLVDCAMSALEREGINKVALVAFKKNDVGNDFWQHSGSNVRDDLVYRNKNIREFKRIDT